jgi:hypothetical protein
VLQNHSRLLVFVLLNNKGHTNMRHSEENLLVELVQSQRREIAKYKWIESEKAGCDIGWQRALEEWLQFHFPAWARQKKNRAIEEYLHAQALIRCSSASSN